MRALGAALVLGACVPTAPMLVPVDGAIPVQLRGLWCGGPAPVRVEAGAVSNAVETCRVRGIDPAASGGVLAEVDCEGPAGPRADLIRLSRAGAELTFQSADGALVLERCT